jgi:hypothetical protein
MIMTTNAADASDTANKGALMAKRRPLTMERLGGYQDHTAEVTRRVQQSSTT